MLTVDFSRYAEGLAGKGRFSRAVFRRLFLDRVLPESYPRLISIDADMRVARPGLGRLADIDLGGLPLAAAFDMIYPDGLQGRRARESSFKPTADRSGLDLETPYFNAGLMVDRPRGLARAGSRRARRARAARDAATLSPSWSRAR